jgi:hypothetical protein
MKIMSNRRLLQTFAFGLCLLAAAVSCAQSTRLIATGWDSPNAARFRAELAAFEQWGVFDGTTIAPTRRLADGRVVDSRKAFSSDHWDWADFADCVRDLQAAQPKQATNNFLMIYANPGNVDWFDDAGWGEVVDHWRLLARVAKQGGLRGLLYDAEPYTPPHSQFRYTAQPGRDQHAFGEYCVQARQRGREVMRAVAAEYPEITVMTYRLFCDLLDASNSHNLAAKLEPHTYALQPAFVDGWCDVMPPTVCLVEGDEDGYRFNSQAEFECAFTRLRLNAAAFVSPENRAKFNAQFRIGHGIYLDAHVNPPSSSWHIDLQGGTAAQRLTANVAAALAASDGFVWIYGEQGRWWSGGNQSYALWPERLSGADQALLRAKDPAGFARAVLREAEPDANRLLNPSFTTVNAIGGTKDWWTWQDEQSHGQFGSTEGTACLACMDNGVFGQTVMVKPGESYALTARVRTTGHGTASLGIGWKTAEGRWTAHNRRGTFVPPQAAGNGVWQEITELIQVPPDAGQLIFMLSAQGQFRETDRAEFDDARLVQVPD